MAHQTRAAINQAASEAAAAIEQPDTPEQETTLAYGAEGPCLTKLVDLLAFLGYATNDVIAGTSSRLDLSVLADVGAARHALGLPLPAGDELLEPAQIPIGVKGELIDTATWDALYAAAAEKVAGQAPGSESTPQDG
jgi:hypothetical protein